MLALSRWARSTREAVRSMLVDSRDSRMAVVDLGA